MKMIFTILLLLVTLKVQATTWVPALPYTQTIEGQSIVIKAKAYQPYDPNPYGLTEVYKDGKFLYSIDRYFREDVFTSDNGEYFIVVIANNYSGVQSVTYFGQKWTNYDEKAILVYKQGVLHKIFTIKDLIDTTKLLNDGVFYDWGYTLTWDSERLREMKYNCESCIEVYGKDVLSTCDTNEIYYDECKECNNDCDSLKLYNSEVNFRSKTIFVRDNLLHIITKQHGVILLDIYNPKIRKVPFEHVVKNKDDFNPPSKMIVYDSLVNIPDQFDFPLLSDGSSVDTTLKQYLFKNHRQLLPLNDIPRITVRKLVLNKSGFCEELQLYMSACPNRNTSCKKLKKIIEEWLMLQQYETSLIPSGFEKFSFYDFIY